MTSFIYLDNSTTTRPIEKAISAMLPYYTTYWGNSNAPHQKGQELNSFAKNYYRSLYQFIGADEESTLVLTSSGAEAINHAIQSVYRDVTLPTGKNHYLTGSLDEASSILAIGRLEPLHCVGEMVEADQNGMITAKALADHLTPRTALLSLSWANGLTGVIQPLKEIAALCKERGVRLHIDATHVIGKLYFDLKELDIDYLTFNGEQFHCPKGSGILYIRPELTCSPFIFGSSDQAGMRAGSLNIASLAAMAYAAEEAIAQRELMCSEIARLRNRLEKGIIKAYPLAKVCFKEQERLPHCTTLLFPGIANEALLFALNRRQIYACIGGGSFQQLGLLLCATGIKASLAQTAVSFSLSYLTQEDEIERAIKIIGEEANRLASLSKHLMIEENT